MTQRLLALLVFLQAAGPPGAAAQEPGAPVSPQEIARLRQQILQETRSYAELLFEFHTESGDLNNRLDFLRYGARVSIRRRDVSLYVSAVRTPYSTVDDVLTATGTGVTVGGRGKLREGIEAQFELGLTSLSTETTTLNGLGSITGKPSEKVRYSLSVSRSNVEESLLSAVGIRPAVGPFAGELVGVVMENRATAGGTYQAFSRLDLYGEASLGTRAGKNVDSNFFRRAGGGIGINIVARSEDQPLSLFRLSASFDYFGFDEDRFGFGGASLLDRQGRRLPADRLGSDGLPRDPSDQSPGVGGYFSPARFVSRLGRLDIRGRPSPSLEYRLSVFLGRQSYTGVSTRGAGGVSADLIFHVGERFSVPVSYVWDDFGPFQQQALLVRLLLRF